MVGLNELANGLVGFSLIVFVIVSTGAIDDGGGGGGGGFGGGFVGVGLGGNGRLPPGGKDGPLDSFEPRRFMIGGGTAAVEGGT